MTEQSDPNTQDTIEVRPDERLDENKIATFLKGKLPGTDQSLSLRQFGGGAANLTYLLDYGSHQYVLRRPPLGPIAPSAHDMAREYQVLSVLNPVFPLAPQAYLYSDDETIVGAHFLVMERRQGLVVRRDIPEAYAHQPTPARQMSAALVDALADFHAVDYQAIGLERLGKPVGFIERQIEGWYRRWHKAKVTDLVEMDEMAIWLRENHRPNTEYSLIHNDYKLDNVMFDAQDPSNIVAIFDWDMSTLGDPLNDLGTLLCYWTEATDPDYFKASSMMPSSDHNFMTRAELVERYAQRSGRDVSHINFYHALGLYRLAVIIAQIYIRYKRGQTQDERFAVFGERVPQLARAALAVAQGE